MNGSRAPGTRPFRIAAGIYLAYGLFYLAGAVYLVQRGLGPHGISAGAAGFAWLLLGVVFLVLFPWLIVRAWRSASCLVFVRILAGLVLIRALGLVRVALRGPVRHVELPWGGEISIQQGAWVFAGLTLCTALVLAWAGWSRPVRRRREEAR